MPQMGKPVNMQARAFQNVQMAPRQPKSANPADFDKMSDREKERLISKLTGYKEKNDLFVDGKKHNKMGKDEFLKLLTVQLKNQDPSNPMKQDKMAAELAQFSQLEQLSNLNAKFDGMAKNQAVENQFYGASFLGKEVVTTGSSLKFEGEGTTSDVLFTLPKPAAKVLVRIFDGNNAMVGEVWKENIGRGNQSFEWDGLQLDGSTSGAGEFKTQVFAWDQFSDPIDVKTKSTGIVESVFFENGETILKVDGKKVFLRDVDSFHNPKPQAQMMLQNMPQANLQNALNKSQMGMQKNAMNNIMPGRPMNGVVPSARNTASNLPLATEAQAKVNLNKMNNVNGMNAYKNQAPPTTGLTSVYDVE